MIADYLTCHRTGLDTVIEWLVHLEDNSTSLMSLQMLDYWIAPVGLDKMYAVHVTLVKAVDLPSADFNGKSDPYVIFQLANTTRTSSVIQANLNPEWIPEETFAFSTEDIQKAVLDVNVFDHDRLSKDDRIGSCHVPLVSLLDRTESEVLMYGLEVPVAFAKQKRKSAIMLEIKLEKQD